MNNLYRNIDRKDLVTAITSLGADITFVVEGDIGSSKSALIGDVARNLPDHTPVYIDMATIADSGDFQLPAVDHVNKTSTFYPNESLGLHTGKPMVIMFDEIGKSTNRSVINAILPALNERRWGNQYFHKNTVVFATTNLGAENVGDMLPPHALNRITKVRMRKPSAQQFIAYAQNHNLHPVVAAWVDRNPQCFQSFEDVEDPRDNPYIYHPREQRSAFVTHRSMTRASTILHNRGGLADDAVTHILAGTIGAPAAVDLMTFVALAHQLPTRQEIINTPSTALLPTSPAALVLLVCQAVQWVTKDTIGAWMQYMNRFALNEVKALFALQMVKNDDKILWASRNKEFTAFAREHDHLFGV